MGRVVSLKVKFRFLYTFNYFSAIQYRTVDAAVVYQEVERDPTAIYVQLTLLFPTSAQNFIKWFQFALLGQHTSQSETVLLIP